MSTEANKSIQTVAKMSASDNRRWVVVAQGVLAAGIWWSVAQGLMLLYRAVTLPRFNPFGWHDANWAALIVVGGAFVYTLRNERAQDFANEVVVELRKVSWPTAKETRQATLVVIICVAVVGIILGTFDFIWAKLIKFLLTYNAGV